MGRFNQSKRVLENTPTTTNVAGGAAYKISEQEELVGGIATSFAADAFYESWQGREQRLTPLIQKYPKLAAQAAVFARRELNMRSISHWVVAQVVRHEELRKEGGFVRDMINRVVIRPDDVTEILAITGDKNIPNGVKRGLADRLEQFNEYQLAKYAKFGRDQEWNLNDAVRLVHAKPTEALTKLMYRTLKNTDTWEAKGNTAEAWKELLREKKLGYMALLRNLRNIAGHNDAELIALAREALLNENFIAKSRVLPFRYLSAVRALQGSTLTPSGWGFTRSIPVIRDPQIVGLTRAVTDAMTLACKNIPTITGTTAILIDGSGSMPNPLTNNKGRASDNMRSDVACLFGAILCNKTKCVPIIYSESAKVATVPVTDNLFDICEAFLGQLPNGGTSLAAAIELAERINQSNHLDRIIVITDEEGWQDTPDIRWFKGETWMFNLAGYGTSEFHPNRRRTVYGFSEKVFNIIPEIEKGGIVPYIENWYTGDHELDEDAQ
jgi:hypothetical protein